MSHLIHLHIYTWSTRTAQTFLSSSPRKGGQLRTFQSLKGALYEGRLPVVTLLQFHSSLTLFLFSLLITSLSSEAYGSLSYTTTSCTAQSSQMNLLSSLLVTGGTIAGSLLTALYVFQEKLLYHPSLPSREYEKKPDDYAMTYVDAEIVAEDGVKIHAWLITQPNSTNASTFLYFHGNAGNLSHRLPDVRQFYASGFNILMVSYRGFGASEGFPTEAGIKLDAKAALEYARDRTDVLDVSRLYLFGRSIGGACALSVATIPESSQMLRGIVLENTFTSIDDMIDSIMPALRFVKPLNRNKWNSLESIGSVTIPMLFIRYLRFTSIFLCLCLQIAILIASSSVI